MEFPYYKKIKSEEETAGIARDFAASLSDGDVVILTGNLGAGKTFFVKQAAKVFGVNNVNSPTFAIVNEYSGSRKIYHFDFYRINKPAELFDIGFNDYLNDPEAVTFIEWGNLMPEVLPEKRIDIIINLNEDFSREFKIVKHG